MVFFSFAKYTNMQKSCPMSPERSSNYIPPHTFYPSTTDISAISATFYMSEERSWDFQSSWSIGALHINTYSKTHLPWCPCNSLRSHSRSCPISWPPRWTQPRPPLMPTSYWTTSSSPSGRTWGTGLTCNFDQLHFFLFTNFDLCSDTSEVALEDNKISGKLFFVGNPLN